ncbi:DUF6961 family protein [Sphingopyxis chilensis]
MRAPCYYLSITLESQAMGMRADRDLWGQALAIESQYGDRGLEVIARKIDELHRAGRYSEAEFWVEVAERLTELHAIRWPGGIREARTSSKMRSDPARPRRDTSTPRREDRSIGTR